MKVTDIISQSESECCTPSYLSAVDRTWKGVEGGEDKTGQHFSPVLGARAWTPPLLPHRWLLPWATTAVARMLGGNIKSRGLLGLNKAEVGKTYIHIFLSDTSAAQDLPLLCPLSIHPLYVHMFGCVKVLPRSLMINEIQAFLFENHYCRYWTSLSTLLLSSCNLQPPEALRVHGF